MQHNEETEEVKALAYLLSISMFYDSWLRLFLFFLCFPPSSGRVGAYNTFTDWESGQNDGFNRWVGIEGVVLGYSTYTMK